MNNYLIIDTSKFNSYIILYSDRKKDFRTLDIQTKVSENLLPTIEQVLVDNHITLQDINYLGVVIGPGSFTGIRVGLATIKAFANALNLKTIAINSFEVVSKKIKNGVLVIKSTNTSNYYGVYKDSKIIDFGVLTNEEFVDKFANSSVYCIENEPINVECKINYINNYCDVLGDIIKEKVKNNSFVNPNAIEPLYAQLSQAEQMLKEKGEKNAK